MTENCRFSAEHCGIFPGNFERFVDSSDCMSVPPRPSTLLKSLQRTVEPNCESQENALNCYFPDHLKHHRSNEIAKFQIHVLN